MKEPPERPSCVHDSPLLQEPPVWPAGGHGEIVHLGLLCYLGLACGVGPLLDPRRSVTAHARPMPSFFRSRCFISPIKQRKLKANNDRGKSNSLSIFLLTVRSAQSVKSNPAGDCNSRGRAAFPPTPFPSHSRSPLILPCPPSQGSNRINSTTSQPTPSINSHYYTTNPTSHPSNERTPFQKSTSRSRSSSTEPSEEEPSSPAFGGGTASSSPTPRAAVCVLFWWNELSVPMGWLQVGLVRVNSPNTLRHHSPQHAHMHMHADPPSIIPTTSSTISSSSSSKSSASRRLEQRRRFTLRRNPASSSAL